jgi:hypothetical protein
MKTFICNHLNGYTFGVEFTNGNYAKYVGKSDKAGEPTAFATAKGAESAANRFRELKGDNWELGNLNYKSVKLVGTELVEKTEFIRLSSTY